MTTITIDLTKNPELAELVSDKQPGDWITIDASIKSKDDQTLTARLERCDDCEKPATEGDEEDEEGDEREDDETENEDDEEATRSRSEAIEKASEKPSKTLASKLTSTESFGM